MNLKNSLLIALTLSVIALGYWELHWRSKGYTPGLEDDKALWAVQRSKLELSTDKDVVLLGSSRVLFDIQLDQWEKETGRRPIQMASAGATPLPSFHDIVQNTNYTGTVVVGVTPGLFFSTTYPMAMPWNRIQSRVNHYYERTYAQRLNHKLAIPLQQSFAFLAADEEEWTDDLNLKTLLNNVQIGNRIGPGMPPFYRFADIAIDRNVKMTEKTARDTSFANTVIEVWKFFGAGSPPPDKESTLAFFLKDAEKFKSRGGNLILIRCPSSAGERMGENMAMPREDYWDVLIDKAKVPNYHFEDHDSLNQFFCPEWSHLSSTDAGIYTTELVKLMIKDKVISN